MTAPPRPVLAVTMGDAAGIGPEIIVKALADPDVRQVCRPFVIGDFAVLDHCRAAFAPGVRLMKAPAPSTTAREAVEVVEPEPVAWKRPVAGRATPEAGRAAVAYIETAARLALSGSADAMVTAPINKAAIRMTGSPFPGHTEMLAHLTGAAEFAMMLVGGGLRVSLATIHVPLARVPLELDGDRLLSVIRLTHRAVISMGCPSPRVAVCGLNPHAGEGGMFGHEEKEVIEPAIGRAAAEGMDVSGPHPGDTVFHHALRGSYDAVVAMYHDQGLGPLKSVAFDEGVNVTLGLPIIRTSVDHGTAYDIAGKGCASPRSLIEAMKLAALMAANR